MTHNNPKAPPLYENIIERIYQYIDETQMAPGSSFPPERELAKAWDVSRNALREAMLVLESRGIVVSRQGQGRFLRSLPPSIGALEAAVSGEVTRYSLIDLYEVCQCLESHAVALAAESATEEQIRHAEQAYRAFCQRMYHSGTIRGAREITMHLEYLEMVDNPCLRRELHRLIDERAEMFEKVDDRVEKHTIEDYVRDHGNILRAIRARDPAEARREMSRHIQSTIDILNANV